MFCPFTIRFCLRSRKGTWPRPRTVTKPSIFLTQSSATRQFSDKYISPTNCFHPHVNSRHEQVGLGLLATAGVQLGIGSSLSTQTLACWKCGTEMASADLFCLGCNALQQPNTKNSYFDVIGVEQSYDINIATLTRKFYQMQNVLHPDRFSNKPAEEQKISEDYSALVNKAYFTLLNPMSRGLYLLELNGIFIEEGKTQLSPQFLMEIMERNEDIDQAQGVQKLRELWEKNKTSLDKLNQEASQAFSSGNIQEAEQILIKMKYYSSIDGKIKEAKQKQCLED